MTHDLSHPRANDRVVTDRLAAWDALHDSIAARPGWVVCRPQRDPLDGTWRVVAVNAGVRGRGSRRPSVEAAGATEAEAVARLAAMVGR